MTDEPLKIQDPAKHMVARRMAYFFAGVICLIGAATFAVAIIADAEVVENLGALASIITTIVLGAFGIIGTYVGTTNWPAKLI